MRKRSGGGALQRAEMRIKKEEEKARGSGRIMGEDILCARASRQAWAGRRATPNAILARDAGNDLGREELANGGYAGRAALNRGTDIWLAELPYCDSPDLLRGMRFRQRRAAFALPLLSAAATDGNTWSMRQLRVRW